MDDLAEEMCKSCPKRCSKCNAETKAYTPKSVKKTMHHVDFIVGASTPQTPNTYESGMLRHAWEIHIYFQMSHSHPYVTFTFECHYFNCFCYIHIRMQLSHLQLIFIFKSRVAWCLLCEYKRREDEEKRKYVCTSERPFTPSVRLCWGGGVQIRIIMRSGVVTPHLFTLAGAHITVYNYIITFRFWKHKYQ